MYLKHLYTNIQYNAKIYYLNGKFKVEYNVQCSSTHFINILEQMLA